MSVLEDSGILDAARSYMEAFSRGWEEGLGKIEEKELEMSDNRITERVRKLLDERGIEYSESQDRFRTRFRFNYCEACGDYLNEIEIMGACVIALKSYLTPEQAIAATLGSETPKQDVDEMRKVSDLLFEAADTIESIGNGTLTAEQVRGVLLLNLPHREYYSSEQTDAWQTIADELNSLLSSKTCEVTYGENDDGVDSWFTGCGGRFTATFENGRMVRPKFCQLCGGEAVKR